MQHTEAHPTLPKVHGIPTARVMVTVRNNTNKAYGGDTMTVS